MLFWMAPTSGPTGTGKQTLAGDILDFDVRSPVTGHLLDLCPIYKSSYLRWSNWE